jgi:hypothetical protein
VTAQRTISGERCNIGPAEIDRRRRIAITLTAATLLVGAILLAAGAPPPARAILWPFAAATGVTWLQVIRRFCVRFAAIGVENYGPLGAERDVDRSVRAADARRAVAMVLEGIVAGLLITSAFVLFPG